MMTISQFASAIGRKNIAAALDVGDTAVSNAVVRGSFPASWYLVVSGMAERLGIECPTSLFTFTVPPVSTQYVDESGQLQVATQNSA